jgi:glucose-6-phosphate dehydrogenase assembly protein OpcA
MTAPNAPIAALQTSGSRWHVRANSVHQCAAQLDAIWASAAEGTDTEQLSEAKLENALGDPRLGGRLDSGGSIRVRMRTSVLTLVVVAPRPETAERAMAVINHLAQRHPSRAIVITPADQDGPAWMDAHIYAECKLTERTDVEVCTEQLLIKAGGELAQHPARIVSPLLIHDLPAVLWWPDDPSFGTRPFREIVEVADRLLVDSGTFAESGIARLAGLAEVVRTGVVVSDIGWLRLALWRELIAGLFDHPLLTPELDHIRTVRVDVARPGQTFRLTKAAYLCGWLAAMLGWEVGMPLHPVGTESSAGSSASGVADASSFVGTFRRGRQEIKVELRGLRATLDPATRSAGSVMRVEIEASRAKTAVRARITRQRDHLLATADWNGAQVLRRAGQLEEFAETPFVAEALERPGLDRIFERALLRAVHFSGG